MANSSMFSLPSATAPGRRQPRRDRRFVGGHEPAQDLRGAGGLDPARAEDVLDAERHAGQRPGSRPSPCRGVDGVGPPARAGLVDQQVAAERAVQAAPPDRGTASVDLARPELARAHAVGDRAPRWPRARRSRLVLLAGARGTARTGDDPGHLEEARLAPGGVRQRLVERQRRRHGCRHAAGSRRARRASSARRPIRRARSGRPRSREWRPGRRSSARLRHRKGAGATSRASSRTSSACDAGTGHGDGDV